MRLKEPYSFQAERKYRTSAQTKEISHVYKLLHGPRSRAALLAGASDGNRGRPQKGGTGSPKPYPHIAGLDPARARQAAFQPGRQTGASSRTFRNASLRLKDHRPP